MQISINVSLFITLSKLNELRYNIKLNFLKKKEQLISYIIIYMFAICNNIFLIYVIILFVYIFVTF